jgi:hypothetical protein
MSTLPPIIDKHHGIVSSMIVDPANAPIPSYTRSRRNGVQQNSVEVCRKCIWIYFRLTTDVKE